MGRTTVRRRTVPIAVAALCLVATLARPALAAAGDRLWIKAFAGTRHRGDRATAMAISPDGHTVFVTGEQGGLESSTVAYEARSGARLWDVHHASMVYPIVATNGRRVFVTGLDLDGRGFLTFALDADTGAVRWTRRYHGPVGSSGTPSGIALSPDGDSVFLTGERNLTDGSVKEGTVAYSARDGATLWSAKAAGSPGHDFSARIAASGARVFVTTTRDEGASRQNDFVTIAYDEATGVHLWTRLFDDAGNWDSATGGVALGPHGASVFVSGESYDGSDSDYVTVGYDAADGSRLWKSRYAGPALYDTPKAITTSPDRSELFVTGSSSSIGGIGWPDVATVALDTVTGTQLWVSRYGGSAEQLDSPLAIVASDSDVFVTGTSASSRQYPCEDGSGGLCYDRDVLTIAYDAGTGSELWVRRHNGTADSDDWGAAVVVDPAGQRVFVTGEEVAETPLATIPRWITIAYDAS